MNPPVGKFDDDNTDPNDDSLWNYHPPKKVGPPEQDPVPLSPHREGDAASRSEVPGSGQAPWKRSRERDGAPQRTAPTSMPPPWKRSKGYRPFVGDVAIAELRNKALEPNRLSDPPAAPSRMKYGMALPFAGVAMVMAAGIAAYKLGSGPPTVLPDEPTKLAASAGDGAPALSNAPPTRSEPDRLDTDTIEVRLKSGVVLMTYGDVTEARMMFQPVAEAGEEIGAFKLAETYDPLVLAGLRLRKQITPDPALARTWYERARDLGSFEARDRISRLAQLPK